MKKIASCLLALSILCFGTAQSAQKYDDRFVLKHPLSNSKCALYLTCLTNSLLIRRYIQALEDLW